MAFDNTNRGSLNRNDKSGGNPNWPDWRGKLNIDGKEYWLDAWEKPSRDGGDNWLSLSVKPKVDKGERTQRDTPQRAADPDDPLPF